MVYDKKANFIWLYYINFLPRSCSVNKTLYDCVYPFEGITHQCTCKDARNTHSTTTYLLNLRIVPPPRSVPIPETKPVPAVKNASSSMKTRHAIIPIALRYHRATLPAEIKRTQ
ncbi:hypothetical protein Zmor_015915 [Zophobas morio]|uniref:Uncharacterized protein n=1 Tax=Zophobas morio TaxID=2755281 RepID=A0AA38MH02_9CUCU|nr:hypothetical protein Zmor_015915 [Zophobas morio]